MAFKEKTGTKSQVEFNNTQTAFWYKCGNGKKESKQWFGFWEPELGLEMV